MRVNAHIPCSVSLLKFEQHHGKQQVLPLAVLNSGFQARRQRMSDAHLQSMRFFQLMEPIEVITRIICLRRVEESKSRWGHSKRLAFLHWIVARCSSYPFSHDMAQRSECGDLLFCACLIPIIEAFASGADFFE